jgi:hypothetical protein
VLLYAKYYTRAGHLTVKERYMKVATKKSASQDTVSDSWAKGRVMEEGKRQAQGERHQIQELLDSPLLLSSIIAKMVAVA